MKLPRRRPPLFPRKGLLRGKTPVYMHRQAVDPRDSEVYRGVNLYKVRMPNGSVQWSALDDGVYLGQKRLMPKRLVDNWLQGEFVGTTKYKGDSLRDKLFSRYTTKIFEPDPVPNQWALAGRETNRKKGRKLAQTAVVYRRPIERIPGTYIAGGGVIAAGGAAAEGRRRFGKADRRRYSDTEFLPSNFNPAPAGTGRRIQSPLDMAAAANVYATNLPRLLSAATGRGRKMSEKDATNSILELLFAGRMQNRGL